MLLAAKTSAAAIDRVGEIMSRDMASGVSVAVFGEVVVFYVRDNGRPKFNSELIVDDAIELARQFKEGADQMVRQGGAGLGETMRFDPMPLTHSIIMPGVALGMLKAIGVIRFGETVRDCLATMLRGNELVLRIFVGGRKHYEIAFGRNQCESMAEYLERAAQRARSAGGAAPPARLIIP